MLLHEVNEKDNLLDFQGHILYLLIKFFHRFKYFAMAKFLVKGPGPCIVYVYNTVTVD